MNTSPTSLSGPSPTSEHVRLRPAELAEAMAVAGDVQNHPNGTTSVVLSGDNDCWDRFMEEAQEIEHHRIPEREIAEFIAASIEGLDVQEMREAQFAKHRSMMDSGPEPTERQELIDIFLTELMSIADGHGSWLVLTDEQVGEVKRLRPTLLRLESHAIRRARLWGSRRSAAGRVELSVRTESLSRSQHNMSVSRTRESDGSAQRRQRRAASSSSRCRGPDDPDPPGPETGPTRENRTQECQRRPSPAPEGRLGVGGGMAR